jgi:hypothetical protein
MLVIEPSVFSDQILLLLYVILRSKASLILPKYTTLCPSVIPTQAKKFTTASEELFYSRMKYLLQFSTPVEIQETHLSPSRLITFRFQLVSKLMVGVQFRRIPAKGSVQ